MAGGLIALLDDIATLAKATASSLDDIAAGAAKASSKAVGVVIDDTAVTPQYVAGLDPSRELPILLILGGSFLCFEGAEKVLAKLRLLPDHEGDEDEPRAASAEELERGIVSSATRTDLILSAEIMLISLANVSAESNLIRVGIMVFVAFFMTFFVYGLVAVLVKMDDVGLRMAEGDGWVAALGRRIVAAMPKIFTVIGILGTVAMLWVGGHIVITALASLGFEPPHHLVELAVEAVVGAGSAVQWSVETVISGVFGLLLGSVAAFTYLGVRRLLSKAKNSEAKASQPPAQETVAPQS